MNNPKFKFNLGSKLRDVVTEFEGIVTARTQHLNGCLRYTIEGPMKEGKDVTFWFDEGRMELVSKEKVKVAQTQTGPTKDEPMSSKAR